MPDNYHYDLDDLLFDLTDMEIISKSTAKEIRDTFERELEKARKEIEIDLRIKLKTND